MRDDTPAALVPKRAAAAPREHGAQAGHGADVSQPIPTITLPKGGGAIRGIGEKFAANPVTGTGSMSIPIATSPGRSGFGPELTLGYDSGAGNGPFGFGWSLAVPSIGRKTDKGLPHYYDADESDVFVIAGSDDLVPEYRKDAQGAWLLDGDGHLVIHEDVIDGYRVRRYRPRTEGLFARIERWSNLAADDDVHWRSISPDNVVTFYGFDAESRIADPLEPTRIFTWLICEAKDDKGNAVWYRYKAETGDGIRLDLAHERNRGAVNDIGRTANRYLKRIFYGNRTPLIGPGGVRPRHVASAALAAADWMFEVVLDYGDHPGPTPTPAEAATWGTRPDPFSSYRAGFEVRTSRKCQRVLMFHHFANAADVGNNCLVHSTDFTYSDDVNATNALNPVYTFLKSVVQTGYRKVGAAYVARSLPPIEFGYTEPVVQERVDVVDAASAENLPVGIDGSTYRWVDLHGEGAPGILTEQGEGWLYKRNLSPIGGHDIKAEFAPVEVVATRPNVALLDGAEITDLAGDGLPDVVVLHGDNQGFFEHDDADGWQPFRPLALRLNRDVDGPATRLVDLTGDGRADILISEDDRLIWHPTLGETGFGPGERMPRARDDERGPRVGLSGPGEDVYLADLSGDGLSDIVRVRNGEVCYWPNLGYGRFGSRITMDNSPVFDRPDQFDQTLIRLADIDGSGTTDLIYLHTDGIRLYFNQSGNGWSEPQVLKVAPRVDDFVHVTALDLLGNGTTCLVWSSPLGRDARRPLRYVNLMGGSKPHLLYKVANNLGAETTVQYVPSTAFYLRDRRAGTPWVTRLAFPVHVVERVTVKDRVSRNRFTTRYAYHHGYFDGEEREFRGFGMVEQWDTEQLSVLAELQTPDDNEATPSHVPPIHTKTWFHTGVYRGRDHVSDFSAGLGPNPGPGEYFREPGLTDQEARDLLLPDTTIPGGLTIDEEREACRALRGSMLRREVFADDAPAGAVPDVVRRAAIPYSVTEQNYAITMVQPRDRNRHAVMLAHPAESIAYHYERDAADPRVTHELTLETDAFGHALKTASAAYGRRANVRLIDAAGNVQVVANPGLAALDLADRTTQQTGLTMYTENRFTRAIDEVDDHRVPMPCEMATFELTRYPRTGPNSRYAPADLVEPDTTAPARLRPKVVDEVAYEADPTGLACRRPIELVRTLYRRETLAGLLPLGEVGPRALAGEAYRLAFTPGLLAQVFVRPHGPDPPEQLLPNPAAVLGGTAAGGGGYLRSQTLKADGRFPASDPDDQWWIPSGRAYFSTNPADSPAHELDEARQHFYLNRRYRNPFEADGYVDFDSDDLLQIESRDALDNAVTALVNDYRVLQPRCVRDPNGNRTQVVFDTLGMVVETAVMGKAPPAPAEGDSLNGYVVDLTQADVDALFDVDDPIGKAVSLLGDATTRFVYDLDRFYRTKRDHPADPDAWRPACAAAIARETHLSVPPQPQGQRVQLDFSYSDGFGREIQRKTEAEPGPLVSGGPNVKPRWVASGWTVFNNKGKPVRHYEPFFSTRVRPDGTPFSDPRFEFGVTVGVSPILFYDPADRVVATLYPNHTYEKVTFSPWHETTFDANDTCAPRNAETGDPRTDSDTAALVADYFATVPAAWKTWQDERAGGARGAREQAAALKAAAHADTPTTAHLDPLGRTFIKVEHNRVECPGHDLDGAEEVTATRSHLDIEGNVREVRDERKLPAAHLPTGALETRTIERFAYDMLGNRVLQRSQDAGARWILSNVVGKAIRNWDSRGHVVINQYDALRRPTHRIVRGSTADSDPRTLNRDVTVYAVEYGEGVPGAENLNLRTEIFREYDAAGIVTFASLDAGGTPTEAYDFKGNLLHATRQFTVDYRALPDWGANPAPALDPEHFVSTTRYDARNRAIQTIAPHSNAARATLTVIQPVHNEANMLERVDVWLEWTDPGPGHVSEPVGLVNPAVQPPSAAGVRNIDYNARGQRTRIDYANGVSTSYGYDPSTFRMRSLYTWRGPAHNEDCDNPAPPPTTIAAPPLEPVGHACGLQNLSYTYDPVGNVTNIADEAQQLIFFRNQRVEPSNGYIYDAAYRLIEATGREHLGQLANGSLRGPTAPDASNSFHTGLDHPNVHKAMGTYREQFIYDAVGNILQVQHRGSDPLHAGWTRFYDYDEPSLFEGGGPGSAKVSNRLTKTTPTQGAANPPEPYTYDPAGNMASMPHLGGAAAGQNIYWDYADGLRRADLGGGGTAYFVYDVSGRRVRKVWEKAPGNTVERLYLNGFELFRRYTGAVSQANLALERETLHVMDDQARIAIVETRTLDKPGTDKAPRQLIRYQLGNHLGSSSVELDGAAQIVSYEEWSPYGSSTYQAVRSHNETPKRYRYTGKERDEESGLAYHNARYYAPWIARWTACDPAGLDGGMNAYVYAQSAPVCWIDPAGREPEQPPTRSKKPLADLKRRSEPGDPHASPPRPPGADAWKTSRSIKGWFKNEQRRTGSMSPYKWKNPKGMEGGHPQPKPFKTHGDNGGPMQWENRMDNDIKGKLLEGKTPSKYVPKLPNEKPKVEAPNVEAPKVEVAKVEAPKVEAPKVEAPKADVSGMAARGAGGKGVGLSRTAGAIGFALLARDLYKAKDNRQRAEIVGGAVVGAQGLALVARVPVVGRWIAAGVAGAGLGVGIGTALAEDVIPDKVQAAYGKVIVEKGFGASTNDIELLEKMSIGGWRPFAPK